MKTDRQKVKDPLRLCIVICLSYELTTCYGKRWQYLMDHGFECWGVASPGAEHEMLHQIGVRTHAIYIERYPSLLQDLVTLVRLWWFFLWHRFDIIDVGGSKASFLTAIAARSSGHRRVVYRLRGMRSERMTGWQRWAMNLVERMVCGLSCRVVPVSRELGEVFVKEGLCPARKICLMHKGSLNGIDLDRFTRTEENRAIACNIRRDLGIGGDDLVILFVGMVRRDKGVNELVDAFSQLAERHPHVHLVILGDYEDPDPCRPDVIAAIETYPRIHRLPWQREPAPVYAVGDLLAFPSYREGFPRAILEAMAMELPVVASDIMGTREGVQSGVTGWLVPLQDAAALRDAMDRLITDPALRREFGANGRRWVERDFRPEVIWDATISLYREVAGQ